MISLKNLAVAASLAISLAAPAFAQSYPEIDFSTRPNYLPNNVISLTFDDAPDWNNTARILDTLKQKNAKATFFINAENWSSLSQDGPMQDLVRRMVNEGHELANHTSRHPHLGSLSADQIRDEINSVDTLVQQLTGRRMTLFRAPFGEPYQLNDAFNPSADYLKVAPIVAESKVHIGWHVDSFDYNCPDGRCVVDNVMSKIQTPGNGDYGVVLLHSVHAQTAAGLPELIDSIRNRGFQLWTVEDVVRSRYGKSSAELVGAGPVNPGEPQGPTQPEQPSNGSCANVQAWEAGRWYEIGEKVVFEGQLFTAINERNPGYHPKISYWFWAAGAMCK